ncbi:hypothetical protein [Celerinatantimonas yamalensis]|uniref:DUF3630 family protein n=1 Tax=Celerinatantimonas yamalensis TaxID=559956 RepID=A0ABW9G9I3_9GAMM
MMQFDGLVCDKNVATIEILSSREIIPEELTEWIKEAFDQSVTPEQGADWWVWPVHIGEFWLLRYCELTITLWLELQARSLFEQAAPEACSIISRYIDVPHG